MTSISNGTWKLESKGYSQRDAIQICRNKLIVFIGGSVVRGMYKDLIQMLRHGTLLSEFQLKQKGEKSFEGDALIEGGVLKRLFNGKSYIEVREFRTRNLCLRFYFVTRCYYDYMETILQDFLEQPVPDVVFMNSCCWDVTRWKDEIKFGPYALCRYRENLEMLFTRLEDVLPYHSMVIWGCTLPVGERVKGGFMTSDLDWQQETLRQDVRWANYFAAQVAADHNCDVIDFYWYFRHFQECRKRDGIHWNASANRNMTYMLLQHISEACGMTTIQADTQYAVPMFPECIPSQHDSWFSNRDNFSAGPSGYGDSARRRRYGRPTYTYCNKMDNRHTERMQRCAVPYCDRSRHGQSSSDHHVERQSRIYRARLIEVQEAAILSILAETAPWFNDRQPGYLPAYKPYNC